jgi:SNF family Na+-dependent transporter
MKNVLIITIIIFFVGSGIYIKNLQKEYQRMQVIATLEEVEWDLEGVPFWDAHKNHLNIFIIVSIILAAAIYTAWRIENENSAKEDEARLRRIVRRNRKVDPKVKLKEK